MKTRTKASQYIVHLIAAVIVVIVVLIKVVDAFDDAIG
jgi:predicted nucleic acid-binding Zn ribbon protein